MICRPEAYPTLAYPSLAYLAIRFGEPFQDTLLLLLLLLLAHQFICLTFFPILFVVFFPFH
jgi:hypothetical protein